MARSTLQRHILRFQTPGTPHDVLEYLLERKRRKTIGLRITSQGLVVSAPQGLPLPALEASILSRIDWIGQKLREVLGQTLAPDRALYLGRELELRRVAGLRGARLSGAVLELPEHDEQALERWYRAQARAHLLERVAHYSGGRFAPNQVRITGARGRWGSCSSEGNLNFSWRTVRVAPELIDYVVVHELCHLEHMDHSPRFWQALESLMPDYRARHDALKKVPIV